MAPVIQDNVSMASFEEPPVSNTPSETDMKFYYERLLPFRYVFQWLSHSPKPTKDFTMREFAYEYRNKIYQRYNSFGTLEEFKKSVVTANPTRFEVGAVYQVNPKERKNLAKTAFKPVSKELVFDIDLTDYDDIRTCCQGTDICCKCWKFIQVGSKIIEAALREDFGFEHLVWVFSGRRGAHCWISDKRARELDEPGRRAIVEYLDVLSVRNQHGTMNLRKPLHPHVERSFDIVKKEFATVILQEQDPWGTQPGEEGESKAWKQSEELLKFIPSKPLQIELRNKWKASKSYSSSQDKWEDINKVASQVLKSNAQVSALNESKKDIIIYYMYPRLDVQVSKQVIHLLKSPFCIHPGTGNVCVPFDPSKNISGNSEDDAYGFNPTTAPNLRLLQTELEAWEDTHKEDESGDDKLPDFDKTSLKPYIDHFAKFVHNLLKDELKGSEKRAREEDPLSF
ncbi:DNA primase small subunit [Candida viswanathii]|uniref:DNA primase n=1 Tax=Candida viswanathii TaxID=5486 RepID=A0A367YL51_9ASCO|nr:DNA primase small subunit [Candida viswanathii]